ncbi:MAG: hypothetical protein OXC41_03935 [Gammaproteobacteria bacterium]|nr:hypothetical protein [Gammaproteobacteria bacterium]
MLEFLLEYKYVFTILVWGSLALFITSIAVIPWLVTKIPCDYFYNERHTSSDSKDRPLALLSLAVVKNISGCILIVLGLVMVALPGQGILTILIGLFLTDFPGKYKLERKLVAIPKVLNSLNWIRAKANKPPLVIGS